MRSCNSKWCIICPAADKSIQGSSKYLGFVGEGRERSRDFFPLSHIPDTFPSYVELALSPITPPSLALYWRMRKFLGKGKRWAFFLPSLLKLPWVVQGVSSPTRIQAVWGFSRSVPTLSLPPPRFIFLSSKTDTLKFLWNFECMCICMVVGRQGVSNEITRK